MVEAPGLQIPNAIPLVDLHASRLVGDFTNAGDRHTIYSPGQSRSGVGLNGEQQFEILTAMKGQQQGIQRAAAA